MLLVAGLLGACSSTPDGSRTSGDPLLDLRNPALTTEERSRSASIAWGEVEAGVRARERTRATFKDLAWSRQTAPLLRAQLVDHLMSDTDPDGARDSLRLAQLMLPREPSPRVAAVICHLAAARGWTDLTPALVRSLGDDRLPGAFEDRPEVFALRSLHPERSLEEVVFGVFLDPGEDPTGREAAVLRWTDRVRQDAWGLLARLDEDRSLRPGFLRDAVASGGALEPESQELARDLLDAWESHRVLPETAMELEWFRSILRPTLPELAEANGGWWRQCAEAVRAQPDVRTEGLRLRHLEPMRWASLHEPALLRADRASLLATLRARLDGRDTNTRTKEIGNASRRKERLRDWEDSLTWADLLTIVVVDAAVRERGAVATLFQHAELDRDDRTTEYGGTLEPDPSSPERYRVLLFRPRQAQRQGDNAFVASDDMLRFSDRALVHHHFQVQRSHNEAFAGPSLADLAYCERSGRTCVVFTSIARDRLGVDIYQPDGAVIDLGEIERPDA